MPYRTRDARQDDYADIADIHDAQNEPHQRLGSERLRRRDRALRRADPAFRRLVAEAEGEVVATGTIHSVWAGAPQPGRLWVLLHARADHRGRGADTALLRRLLEDAPADAHEVLTCIREDFLAAAGFLGPAGFQEAFRSWGAHLDPQRFDPAPFEPRIRALSAAGIRVASYAELERARYEPELLDLQRDLERDVPAFPPVVPERLEDLTSPDAVADATFVAIAEDGVAVGLSGVVRGNGDREMAFSFTGVRPAHRRRGIATALKARAAEAAARLGCLDLNAGGGGGLDTAIVRANRALGFHVEPAWVTLACRR